MARDQMAPLLEAVSWVMPFTWAYDALARAVFLSRSAAGSPSTPRSSSR